MVLASYSGPGNAGTPEALDRDRLAVINRSALWAPQPGPQLDAFPGLISPRSARDR
jgi:hypothetical protein